MSDEWVTEKSPKEEGCDVRAGKSTSEVAKEKPACPRCGIGTPVFGRSCIVCINLPDPHAALILQLLKHKLAAEDRCRELEAECESLRKLNGKVARLEADLVGAHYLQKGLAQDNSALSAQVGELDTARDAEICRLRSALEVLRTVPFPVEYRIRVQHVVDAALRS